MRPERFVVPRDLLSIEALMAVLLLSSLFLFSMYAQQPANLVALAQTYAGAFDPAPETTRPLCSEAPAYEMSVRLPRNRMMP